MNWHLVLVVSPYLSEECPLSGVVAGSWLGLLTIYYSCEYIMVMNEQYAQLL